MGKPRITETDLCRAARRAGTSTSEIETFLEVETKGKGFDAQDRPIILFERHWFHKFTKGKFDSSHPDISNPTPGGYGKSSEQYDRFSRAFALDPEAAMKSASWGLGQVMGFNYAICGYSSVGEFVDAMKESEGKQLDAAIDFIIHNGLQDELRRHDWRGFARGYNGKTYEKNDYHTKLKAAYTKFSKRKINCSELPTEVADNISNEPDIAQIPDPDAADTKPDKPPPEPQTVKKETPSTFIKWITAAKLFVGTVIASVTAWFGGNDVAASIAQRGAERAVDNVDRPFLVQLGIVLLYTAIGVGAGVLLIYIATKFYDRSAQRANLLNQQKINAAADTKKATVEFEQ